MTTAASYCQQDRLRRFGLPLADARDLVSRGDDSATLTRRRLTRGEISLLRDLALRAGASGRVTLAARQRGDTVELWRRGLVEVWYRQCSDAPSLRGPFYALSIRGFQFATLFLRRNDRAVQG